MYNNPSSYLFCKWKTAYCIERHFLHGWFPSKAALVVVVVVAALGPLFAFNPHLRPSLARPAVSKSLGSHAFYLCVPLNLSCYPPLDLIRSRFVRVCLEESSSRVSESASFVPCRRRRRRLTFYILLLLCVAYRSHLLVGAMSHRVTASSSTFFISHLFRFVRGGGTLTSSTTFLPAASFSSTVYGLDLR